jgi:GNAT superfamily N-acetyltransferase
MSPTSREGQLRAWADESLLDGFALLARHPPTGTVIAPRRFGTAIAYATGRRMGFFNPIAVLEPVAPADLAAAIAWVHGLGMPLSLRVRADVDTPEVLAVALEHGLVRSAWVDPAMAMHPLVEPPPLPAGLTIEPATRETLDRFYEANAFAFHIPSEAAGLVRDLTPPETVDDPDIRLFSGYLDGEPVASSFAIRSEHVVGVYAVGTGERARRRGIGTAMTWAVVQAGQEWGCEAATLQASEMGQPVYARMGFVEVAGYISYDEPPRARAASS